MVERPWQRRVLGTVWLHLAVPVLLLLTRPHLVIDGYLITPPQLVPSPFAVSWLFVRFVQADAELRARMRLMLYVIVAFGVLAAVQDRFPQHPVRLQLLRGASVVLLAMVPVSVVIGVVRHRLSDIDLAIRRSVTFGLLSLGIAAVYMGLSAAPGLALGDQTPVEVAVVLTIAAAAVFQPVRRRLEKLAGRLVFGERVNRYELVARFGAGLEQTVELADLLPRLADTVHEGLAADWVRVTLPGAHAVAGRPAGEAALTVPLERAGETIGRIECAGRRAGTRRPTVLREMAQGKTNAGIEQALRLSCSTVEKHVNAIFSKLGLSDEPVHRRVAAVPAFPRESATDR